MSGAVELAGDRGDQIRRWHEISDMMRGDFSNISEHKLMDCLNRLGYDIEITLKATNEPVGRLTMAAG